jgi:8-oxo-dGTP diphosphatase
LPASSITLASLAIIRDDDGRFLLVRHTYKGRRWAFPGGMLEPGESPQQAVAREVLEEVGLEVEVGPLVAVYTLLPQPVGYRFVFECSSRGTPEISDRNEIDELGWFLAEQLPAPRTPSVAPAVADAAAGLRGVVRELHPLETSGAILVLAPPRHLG